MSLGKKEGNQTEIWVPFERSSRGTGHPFYQRLNVLFGDEGFDTWLEALCEPYFATRGRASIPPGVYFRMLMIGYFEGITSERGIAWRCADSLSLRRFLGIDVTETPPDHSTLSVWRRRLDGEVYEAVFRKVLDIVDRHGLLDGSTLGVDSSPVEANAAMKSIVRKDTKENYPSFLRRLAEEAGEECSSPRGPDPI